MVTEGRAPTCEEGANRLQAHRTNVFDGKRAPAAVFDRLVQCMQRVGPEAQRGVSFGEFVGHTGGLQASAQGPSGVLSEGHPSNYFRYVVAEGQE